MWTFFCVGALSVRQIFFFLPKCFMFILSFAHFTSLNSMLFTNTSPQILSRPETDVDVSSSRLISKMCCWLIRMLSKKKIKANKTEKRLDDNGIHENNKNYELVWPDSNWKHSFFLRWMCSKAATYALNRTYLDWTVKHWTKKKNICPNFIQLQTHTMFTYRRIDFSIVCLWSAHELHVQSLSCTQNDSVKYTKMPSVLFEQLQFYCE